MCVLLKKDALHMYHHLISAIAWEKERKKNLFKDQISSQNYGLFHYFSNSRLQDAEQLKGRLHTASSRLFKAKSQKDLLQISVR